LVSGICLYHVDQAQTNNVTHESKTCSSMILVNHMARCARCEDGILDRTLKARAMLSWLVSLVMDSVAAMNSS
jgi:hypothetical protein